MIDALMIDSREPEWVQKLTFNGLPTMVTMLEHGDLAAVCSDGRTILIERKTVDDLLSSIADGRLLNQAARMVSQTRWCYLLVTDQLRSNRDGMVISDRGPTNWRMSAVYGALLSVQEMGIFVIHCNGDNDYERCVLSIGQRDRQDDLVVEPARFPRLLTPREQVLAALPGIGIERLQAVLAYAGSPAWALVALTDRQTQIPGVPNGVKEKIRRVLGLLDSDQIAVSVDNDDNQILVKAQLGAQ